MSWGAIAVLIILAGAVFEETEKRQTGLHIVFRGSVAFYCKLYKFKK